MGYVTLGSKAVGSIVKIKENNLAVELVVLKHGYPTDGNGRTLVIRKDLYDTRPINSQDKNVYANGEMDIWLNGTYLAMISSNIREQISAVNILCTVGGGNQTLVTISRKVFLLSATEVGFISPTTLNAEGAAISYFNSNARRIAYLNSVATDWWTRSPRKDRRECVWRVLSAGGPQDTNSYISLGSRPAFTIPEILVVSDTGFVTTNQTPTTPPPMTTPEPARGGKPCALSWAAATDVDGNLAGYRLERSVAGGAWAQIYEGANRTHTDQITRGWTTIAYRVRAYDAEGATSGYTTSPTRTVVNNLPPAISGADSNLGTLAAAPFSTVYSATDDDGDPIIITERLNNTVLRTFTATAGTQYTVTMTADQWMQVLNGSHTLTVTAADDHGGQTVRTFTFAKQVDSLCFWRKVPYPADAAAERCILTVLREIPIGAQFKVEVCNNGFDASPTWEDCTAAVLAGRKFFFTNKAKTAAQWGFNYRVTVNRNGAEGPCRINHEVRGAFD